MAYGFGALNKNFNTKNNFSINNALKQENIISTGRVINVILDGDDASAIWDLLIHTQNEEEKEKMIKDLKAYCKMDTLATVKIHEVLSEF